MPSREGACEAARLLASLPSPRRGGHKGFTPAHALMALDLLERRAGRPSIARTLGLGEASAKTLLRSLEEAGLAARSSRGRTLTPGGRRVLEELRAAIRTGEARPSPFPGEPASYVIVRWVRPPETLIDVYTYRDYAVLSGCRTVMVGAVVRGATTFPGTPEDAAPSIEAPEEWSGAVLVGPARCERELVDAALLILASSCGSTGPAWKR
ncbi:MAG: hypothetical protein F7C34_04220 [Desulfurococcales archaeon]|nr:hypothetical protein [Desulfurococcales archaeon]